MISVMLFKDHSEIGSIIFELLDYLSTNQKLAMCFGGLFFFLIFFFPFFWHHIQASASKRYISHIFDPSYMQL